MIERRISDPVSRLHTGRHALMLLPALLLQLILIAPAIAESVTFELELGKSLVHYATTVQLDPKGIRREDAVLHATYLDGSWFGSRLRSLNNELDRRLAVFDLDTTGLAWDGEHLRGRITAAIGRIDFERDYGEGENMHSALKARRRSVIDWHIGGMERIYPSRHQLDIDARIVPDGRILELTLDQFAGDDDQRRPLHLTLTYRNGRWVTAEGLAPRWNRAVHSVDASDLIITEDGVTGSIKIRLNPDPWVPRSGPDGTRFRHYIVELDLQSRKGRIAAQYLARTENTRFTGAVRGLIWKSLEGSYEIQGVDGRLSGRIRGKVRPADTDQAQLDQAEAGPDMTAGGLQTRPWSDLARRLDITHELHPESRQYLVNDYTGQARHYQGVRPPMLFDIEQNTNIAWRVPLPSTPAPPVVIGDRIYAVIPPDVLVCLDAHTGRERWRRATNVIQETAPDIDGRPGTLDDLRKAWDRRAELSAELSEARRELRRHRHTTEEHLQTELQQQIASLEQKISTISANWRAASDYLAALGIHEGRQSSLGARAGAPPVTDGSRIWVVFGTGVAACFDLDGNPIWQVTTGLSWTGGAEHAPVLTGSELVLMGTLEAPEGQRVRPYAVQALCAATGQARWRTGPLKTPPGLATMYLPAGNGHDRRLVHVTADGTLIDGRDGLVVAEAILDLPDPIPPLAYGDRAYLVANIRGQMAIQVSLDDGGSIRYEQLWRIARAGSSSHQITAPGLIHDGLLYLPRSTDESGGHHPVAWCQLDTYERAFGQHVARPNAIVTGTFSPLPLVRAGNVLVFSDEGRRGHNRPPRPMISFVAPGPRPKLLTRVALPAGHLHAAPVFHGNRMIIRLNNEIICIGTDTPQVARQEAELIARELIASIGHRPMEQAITIAPVIQSADDRQWPVVSVESNIPPDRWLMHGPFSARDGSRKSDARLMSTQLRKPEAGNDTAIPWRELPPNISVTLGPTMVHRSEGTFYRISEGLDVGHAVEGRDHSRVYFLTVLNVLENTSYALRNQIGKVWISGREVQATQTLNLEKGYHPMVIEVEIAYLPPVGRVVLHPSLSEVVPTHHAIAHWLAEIRRHEAELRKISRGDAGENLARRAQRLLDALAQDDAIP